MPDETVGMRIGGAIRDLRREAHVSQRRLVEGLIERRGGNAHQPTFSKWERGEGSPDHEDLAIIEDLCGRPRGTIYRRLGWVDDPVTPEDTIRADPRLTPENAEILVGIYSSLVSRSPKGPDGPAKSVRKPVQTQRARRR